MESKPRSKSSSSVFCSTIIPTIGRKSLRRAVESVLSQRFSHSDYEVIVVNDSGSPLPAEAWQTAERITILQTARRERSIARNVGAAVSRGVYLHFLDDDDWMLPGALDVFWQLARENDHCAWLYGGARLYDRDGVPIQNLVHQLPKNCLIQAMAGEWIPLQASTISEAAFHSVGGFNPRISGPEDIDLARRIALRFDFAGTSELVACIEMGVKNSTTDSERSRLEGREARELIINEPGVLRRMWSSAGTSFWYGRIARVYLTSLILNARKKDPFTAFSRMFFALTTLVACAPHLFSRDFWKAVKGPYASQAFERGRIEACD